MGRIDDLARLMAASDEQAFEMAEERMRKAGLDVIDGTPYYLIGVGERPVLLTAHVDTYDVGDVRIDHQRRIITGRGGDDRAGVFAIFDVLDLRPMVVITSFEEKGGIGASRAAYDHPWLQYAANVVIGLDRRGGNDAVFYGCGSIPIRQWTQAWGWKEARGSYADTDTLGYALDRAAVNLSIGYFNEHTAAQYVVFDLVESTIRRLRGMLDDLPDTPWTFDDIYYEEESWVFDDIDIDYEEV